MLRAGAWTARGLRVPARNALLADVVPRAVDGRAYGFERAMDNLGAIGGPLLALVLLELVGMRTAILLSIVPGLLAVLAVVYAIRRTPRPSERERIPIRLRVRPVLQGRLGRLFIGVGVFELGNVAATLFILRATDLLSPERRHPDRDRPLRHLQPCRDRGQRACRPCRGPPWNGSCARRGCGLFALAYAGFAATDASIPVLALCFAAAGIGIGCAETAEHAAVATLASDTVRGSAFGLLAAVQASATSPPAP